MDPHAPAALQAVSVPNDFVSFGRFPLHAIWSHVSQWHTSVVCYTVLAKTERSTFQRRESKEERERKRDITTTNKKRKKENDDNDDDDDAIINITT